LVFVTTFLAIATNGILLRPSNLVNLVNQSFTVSLIAIGAAFVYAHGGLDFSIGAGNGLAQYACVLVIVHFGLPLWVGILAAIMIGLINSSLVGGLSILLRVNPFISSLCMRAICVGLLSTGVNRLGGQIRVDFHQFEVFNNWGLRLAFLLVIIGIGFYLFEKTSIGKSEKAIGGNIITAFQSGIRITKLRVMAYAFLGICVGLAVVFQLARFGQVTAQSGEGLEFDIMVAIILGGFPMAGGAGAKILSVIVGAVTATVLFNGLILWGVDVNFVNGIRGLLFIAIIAISYDRSALKQVKLTQ